MKHHNITTQVADAVSHSERGRITIEQLAEQFPDVPKPVIQKALENASFQGRIHLLMKGGSRGWKKGTRPGVWGPVPQWVRERLKRPMIPLNQHGRPVASVWELGTR